MSFPNDHIVLAFWIRAGEWEYQIHSPHGGQGQKHIHVRRKRKRTGEYSWNLDGSRHDKGKFPAGEQGIERAKGIASERIGVTKDSLQFIDYVDRGGRFVVAINGVEVMAYVGNGLFLFEFERGLVVVGLESD